MNSRDMDAIKSVMIEQRDEKMDRLERERNELLAALEKIANHEISCAYCVPYFRKEDSCDTQQKIARVAIDKAKGV